MSRTHINLRPVPVRSTGHIRAVVHTGHEYDKFGNIIREGIILRETKLHRNTITNPGFDRMFNNKFNTICMVAGSGNTAPSPSDTTLASYLGKTQTFASASTTRNTTPDINNEVWWRTTKRMTFAPSSLGGGSVNVAEAGIVTNIGFSSINSSSPVSARGLLVDEFGNPTTVSVDNSIEYLDIIWEYTEWIPASVTGTVELNIDGTPTNFDYEVRPYNFDNTGGSFNSTPWVNASNNNIPGWGPAGNSTYTWSEATNVFAGPLGVITGNPLGNGTRAWIPIMASSAYTNGSKTRSLNCTWLPTVGNVDGGIGAFRVDLGHSAWQISMDPKIAKINTKQLDMTFTLTMDNR